MAVCLGNLLLIRTENSEQKQECSTNKQNVEKLIYTKESFDGFTFRLFERKVQEEECALILHYIKTKNGNRNTGKDIEFKLFIVRCSIYVCLCVGCHVLTRSL